MISTFAAALLAGCGPEDASLEGEDNAFDTSVSALGDDVVTDLYLVASNSSTPPAGPTGYTFVGNWDVDSGGALGTGGSAGSYMTALYARYQNKFTITSCVQVVHLQASNSSSLPATLSPNLSRRGYWDVDAGGANGGNGTSGSYMSGLYTTSGPATGHCVFDVVLVASNSSTGPCYGGYDCAGSWDVGGGGSTGTFGSTGTYRMALSTLSN